MSSAGQGRDGRFPGVAFRFSVSGFRGSSLTRCTVRSAQYGIQGDAFPAVWTEWLWGAFPQTVTAGLATASWAGLDATVEPGAVTVTAGLATASWAGLDATVDPGAVAVAAGLATASWAGLDATVEPGAVTVTAGLATASWAGLDATAIASIRVVAGRANATWGARDATGNDNAPAPRRRRKGGIAAGVSPWARRQTAPVPVPPLAPPPPSPPPQAPPAQGGTSFGATGRTTVLESAALKMAMALQGKTRAAALTGVATEEDQTGTKAAAAEIGALLEDDD